MTYYQCTGRAAGRQDVCTFSTQGIEGPDTDLAFDHFEATGHDVEQADDVAPVDYVHERYMSDMGPVVEARVTGYDPCHICMDNPCKHYDLPRLALGQKDDVTEQAIYAVAMHVGACKHDSCACKQLTLTGTLRRV